MCPRVCRDLIRAHTLYLFIYLFIFKSFAHARTCYFRVLEIHAGPAVRSSWSSSRDYRYHNSFAIEANVPKPVRLSVTPCIPAKKNLLKIIINYCAIVLHACFCFSTNFVRDVYLMTCTLSSRYKNILDSRPRRHALLQVLKGPNSEPDPWPFQVLSRSLRQSSFRKLWTSKPSEFRQLGVFKPSSKRETLNCRRF